MNPERRILQAPLSHVEVRSDDDGNKKIRGYAAVYYDGTEGTQFRLWSDMIERIQPGAFDGVLDRDVRALFNHEPNFVLGRTSAGTARIFSDERGLGFEIDPPASRADVLEALERGDVNGSSFSFSVQGDGGKVSYVTEDDVEIRTIERVSDLFDVGPVTFPAYEGTEAYARDAEAAKREYEQIKAERSAQNTPKTISHVAAKARARVVELDIVENG